LTGFSPERTAAALMGLRRQRRRVPMGVLAAGVRPSTVAEGVAAQFALATLADQAAPGGFKIGATTAQMQAYLGLDGPAAGFMPRDNLHAGGSTLSYAPFLRPGVECELAVHLARDLPPGPCSAAQAAEAVDLLMAAIEIVENRYADLAAFGTPALIADQVFHAGAVLGAPLPGWRELDLVAVPGRMTVNGVEVGHGRGGDLLGHPMNALAWLAGSAEVAAFGGLRAGQIVMLGSVTPPIWLEGPAVVRVAFEGLDAVELNLV
jgi:2-keto-4-pentenoate hydratase